MTDRPPLEPLFEPQTVAVIGASSSAGKAGNTMVRSLSTFPGRLYPVNPNAREVLGHAAHPSVVDLPEPVDLAILTVPPQAVPGALRECAAAGVRAAVVCAGGMGESGPEGARLQDETLNIAREGGIRVLGPNTSGFVNPPAGICASFVPGVAALRPGNVAIVAQSGGVNHALAFAAQNEGVGISLAVGLGNAMDISAAAVLEYLAGDESTRAIMLHVEGVLDGRRLFEALERTVEKKPVVALKVGRADVGEFARSHTGSLTGSWRLARSALAQAGAVVVESATEMLDAARTLEAGRLPPGENPGVAVVSGQAGPALLIADALRTAGVELPELRKETIRHLETLLPPLTYQRNPVDTGRPDESFGDVLIAVASDPAVEALIVYALHEPEALDPVSALGWLKEVTGVPVVFVTGGPQELLAPAVRTLEAAGVPVHLAPERGALAARALVGDARAIQRLRVGKPTPHSLATIGTGTVDEAAAKDLLDAVGLATPRRRVCATREEAHRAREELGGRVVVKVLDAAITHKSEVGGVHVDVDSAARLDAALAAIDRANGASSRYLVEELAPPGVELILGGVRDASFGPTVLLGLGGVSAEALGDVAVRLAPLSAADAGAMVDELSGKRLLEGFRGQPVADRTEVVDAILAVSRLLLALPEVSELDINPVRVTDEGLLALDAVILTADE